jgi:hypothetical protein
MPEKYPQILPNSAALGLLYWIMSNLPFFIALKRRKKLIRSLKGVTWRDIGTRTSLQAEEIFPAKKSSGEVITVTSKPLALR